ncbi:hypothetical protein [Pseudoalteromonas umbrosa]|uniref:hypothetical protein n=1 Tax=Pseudoalteromonas umbrosa TaxID=3048489 RepID=UPI0024C40D79|nr:hypothetical protein [Pseudoalteromonas sp. B95]MDK1286424.1 hypothetical protein [Pseudoalteromonas sp. B95]
MSLLSNAVKGIDLLLSFATSIHNFSAGVALVLLVFMPLFLQKSVVEVPVLLGSGKEPHRALHSDHQHI